MQLNDGNDTEAQSLLKQRMQELFDDKSQKKLSTGWLSDAVRHYQRNCYYDTPEDGEECGRYDGEIIADIINILYKELNP